MGQILNKGDASGTSDADNNADAGADNTSGMEDTGGTSGMDNNFDSQNAYTKTDFNTYNIVDMNPDADVGASADDTTDTVREILVALVVQTIILTVKILMQRLVSVLTILQMQIRIWMWVQVI